MPEQRNSVIYCIYCATRFNCAFSMLNIIIFGRGLILTKRNRVLDRSNSRAKYAIKSLKLKPLMRLFRIKNSSLDGLVLHNIKTIKANKLDLN